MRVGQLVADLPRIAELDINPLIALPDGRGVAVADVRIRLTGKSIETSAAGGLS